MSRALRTIVEIVAIVIVAALVTWALVGDHPPEVPRDGSTETEGER